MPHRQRKWKERKKNGSHPAVDMLLYLPYVDDKKTPEEIMKMFEAVEDVEKEKEEERKKEKESHATQIEGEGENNHGEDDDYDEESLKKVFSRIGTGIDFPREEDDDELEDDEFQITGEEEDDDLLFFDDFEDGLMRKQFRYTCAFRYVLSHSCQLVRIIAPPSVPQQCYRVDEDTSGGISLHPIGETAVPYPYLYIRIPTTFPSAFCRTVLPYAPESSPTVLSVKDPLRFNLLSLNRKFNVIFFDIPTDFDVQRLHNVHLPRSLISEGFVLIWADYSTLSPLLDIFENKGFFYVENLSMIYPHSEDSPTTKTSLLRPRKRMLLLLRRGRKMRKGNIVFDPLDLRHQRSVDVVFAAYSENPNSLMQQSVHSMIETLVPRGEDGGLKNCDEYLQVFGKGSNGRPHWIVILEESCSVCNKQSNINEKVAAPSRALSPSAPDGRKQTRLEG